MDRHIRDLRKRRPTWTDLTEHFMPRSRVAARSSNDYAVARRAEEESRREFAQEKREADRLNDKAIEYAIVRQEAEESRGLYEDLLKRLKEAGVLQGLRSSNITVVDPGRTPSRPKQPNVPLYLGLSLGAGSSWGPAEHW